MRRTFTLAELLGGPGGGTTGGASRELAEQVLKSGLQDVLLVMCAAMAAPLMGGGAVPPGFAGRWLDGLVNPSPGKLLQLLGWLAVRVSAPPVASLADYLQMHESKEGFLSRLGQLRNCWAHPKDESPAQAIEEAAKLVGKAPPLLERPAVRASDNGEIEWVLDNVNLSLDPFVVAPAGRIEVFAGMGPDGVLEFDGQQAAVARFTALWRDARARDPKLEAPTAADFHAKARCAATVDGVRPWCLTPVLRSRPVGVVVTPDVGLGIAAHARTIWPAATVVVLAPTPGTTVGAALAQQLGLAAPPTPADVARFALERPVVLIVQADAVTARDFLQALYWLADLRDAAPTGSLRVVLTRAKERLDADDDALWDRLPEPLDELLQPPPGTDVQTLADLLWSAHKPKRFLGLF